MPKWLNIKLTQTNQLSFLHTNDKQAEKEIREAIPFTIATKKYKIFWCNSNQASERSVWQELQIWRKKPKKTSKDGKISHAHRLVGLT